MKGILKFAKPPGYNYLLLDQFNTSKSPLLSRAAEPGPGILALTQVDGQFSISGGKLVFPAQSTPVWGDLGFAYAPLNRSIGRALLTSLNHSAIGGSDAMMGWLSNGFSSTNALGCLRLLASGFAVYASTGTENVTSLGSGSTGVAYDVAIICRSTGYLYFVRGGIYTNWTLLWPGKGDSSATIYPGLANYDAAGTVDDFRVLDLPAPYTTDYGISTQRLVSPSGGATFAHTADCLLDFTVTTLPSSGTAILVYFRKQDSNNYWRILVNSAGDFQLTEVVAASGTQRGLASGVVANGQRIVVVAEGSTIKGYSNNFLRWTYSSATNFATQTAAELNSLGTGGVLSEIVTWPRTVDLDTPLATVSPSNYLLYDQFTTAKAAPLVPATRNAEPGPGFWTVTDPANNVSIVGGQLRIVGGDSVNTAGIMSNVDFPLVAGRAFIAEAMLTGGALYIKDTTTFAGFAGGDFELSTAGTTLRMPAGTAIAAVDTIPNNVAFRTFALVRSASGRNYYIIDNKLQWISASSETRVSTLFPSLGALNPSTNGYVDRARLVDLAPLDPRFATDYGLATQLLTSPSAGATFIHEANFLLDFTVTTLPSAGHAGWVEFRIQDSNNKWFAWYSSAGDFRLYEQVAGSSTQKAAAAAVLSAGHRIVVIVEGSVIKGFSNNLVRWTYSSATNFQTSTAGRYFGDVGADVVSEIVAWPRTLSLPQGV